MTKHFGSDVLWINLSKTQIPSQDLMIYNQVNELCDLCEDKTTETWRAGLVFGDKTNPTLQSCWGSCYSSGTPHIHMKSRTTTSSQDHIKHQEVLIKTTTTTTKAHHRGAWRSRKTAGEASVTSLSLHRDNKASQRCQLLLPFFDYYRDMIRMM